jgi:hypothetical protein
MLVLKPEVILAVLMIPWRCVTKSAYCDWLKNLPCAQWTMSLFSNAAGSQRQSKVVVQLLRRETKKITSRGSRLLSKQLSKHTMKEEDPEEDRDNAFALAVGSHTKMDRASAAMVLQTLWRHRKPRVLAAHRSILILRRNLLSFVSTAKHLGREDFLLLFSYAVYSALCDTCFMYFDCSEYEDGEVYLAADVRYRHVHHAAQSSGHV